MFGLVTANVTPYKLELATLIFTENMKGQWIRADKNVF